MEKVRIMLVNKNKPKTTKAKPKKASEEYEENIQSMRSWVRKIEQTTNSVSSRLSAVEKRISGRKVEVSHNPTTGTRTFERPLQKAFAELKGGSGSKEISQILDDEFARLQDELTSQETEIDGIKEKIDRIHKSINEIKEEMKKTREVEARFLTNFRNRIEVVERRAPPVMKLGKMEVPIEIAGVTAGSIAIIAALCVAMDQTSILISPAFLGIVGFVFIGSAVFKAVKSKR